jgi:hypothetical protein
MGFLLRHKSWHGIITKADMKWRATAFSITRAFNTTAATQNTFSTRHISFQLVFVCARRRRLQKAQREHSPRRRRSISIAIKAAQKARGGVHKNNIAFPNGMRLKC